MRAFRFIAFEGIDGSGKSTQVRLLAEKLRSEGLVVEPTFEPTNGVIGSLLRNILKGSVKADERTIAALFLADRLDHLLKTENGIASLVGAGKTVLTDRYYFSSYAYHGSHVSMDWVIDCNKECQAILQPDCHVFINVSPEVAIERIRANRDHVEIYETLDNLRKVREKYFEAFDKLAGTEKIVMVDGDQQPERVAAEIWRKLEML